MSRSRGYSVVGRKLTTISSKIKLLIVLIVILIVLLATFLTIYFIFLHDFGHQESEDPSYQEFRDPSDGRTWYPECKKRRGVHNFRGKVIEAFNSGESYFDCYPDSSGVSESKCRARGCCWNKDTNKSPVRCFYPDNYGYELDGDIESVYDGFEVPLKRLPMPSRYGDDIQQVRLKVEPQTPHRLHVLFYDKQEARYQVPDPKIEVLEPPNEEQVPLYSLNYNTNSSPFNLNIRRTDTETIIFDTSIGGFTFSPQFLQLSSRLPSKKVFGLSDEDLEHFGLDLNWKTWLLFSRKSQETNYGSHPFYLCVEKDGRAHGVLLLNSNALEVQLQPMPAVTFRTIGGLLDFYFFLGPTPQDVIQQYAEAVGFPQMPPYWSLGLHVSSNEPIGIQELQANVDSMSENNVTLDVLHLDIHDDEAPFVYSQNKSRDLQNLTSTLKSNEVKVVLKVYPSVNKHSVPFDVGAHHGVFVNDSWRVNPVFGMNKHGGVSAIPDFGNHATLSWWTDRLKELNTHIPFNGLWLEDNSPVTNLAKGSQTGCLPDNFNKPPFSSNLLQSAIYDNTLCMDSVQWCGPKVCNHYDLHNIYGHLMAKTTSDAVRNIYPDRRTMIISSSTFAGSGRYAGHGDSTSKLTWDKLNSVLSSTVLYGFFGIPFSGRSLSFDSKDEELNLRALQLMTFLPYVHVELKSLMVETEKPEFLESFQSLIQIRYELLPYLYSLFHLSHEKGTLPIQPLWFQFPKDEVIWEIKSQFLWGSSLMISPVLEKGSKTKRVYLPESDWFDYYTGEKMAENDFETESYLYSTIKPIALHVKAGQIIPQQIAALNLETSRSNPMMVLVALDSNGFATGYLFWDDGDCLNSYETHEYVDVHFEASPGLLKVKGQPKKQFFKSSFDNADIEKVKIYGLTKKPSTITIDGNYNLLPKQIVWNQEYKVLLLHQIRIPISRETIVEWSI